VPAGTRLNRALWAFRATFALLALVLLAIIVRPEASTAARRRRRRRRWRPDTAARRRAPPWRCASTRPAVRCGSARASTRAAPTPRTPGASWAWRWGWWPTDGRDVRFDRDGRLLRVASVGEHTFDDGVFGQLTLAMRATVAPDGERVRGWVRLSATFFYAIGPTTCDSGRVPFAVGATSGRPS
jgi:hypothetical protein